MTDEIDEPQVETTPEPQPEVVDVDATWDGEGSLDDHREKELATIEQSGFGREGVKKDG